jgi:signal transduction histidine kinase
MPGDASLPHENTTHENTTIFPRPIRLLIIDDDSIDRQRYQAFLRNGGQDQFLVTEASSAVDGIDWLTRQEFDCVVLDYRLPGVDGLSLLQSLHQNKRVRSLPPVVMMTGQGSETVAVDAMKLGTADYLRKEELNAEAFCRAIRNAVDRTRLRYKVLEKRKLLQAANAELKQRADEMQRLYHVVSHELKTPLTAVREFIALVLDGVAGPLMHPDQKEYLQHALDGCDQIARHVNDLSDSARLESQKLTLTPAAVRVEKLVDFAVASLRSITAEKRLKLSTHIAPNLPPVRADELRVSQVLGNLLGNAAKFTAAGGEISLRVAPMEGSPDQIEFSVTDTGCGIAPEHLDLVFNRLYQVPQKGEASLAGGLGLGLSIARELVQLHGGRLTVQSTVGQGSTFKFHLAASKDHVLTARSAESRATLAQAAPVQASGRAQAK